MIYMIIYMTEAVNKIALFVDNECKQDPSQLCVDTHLFVILSGLAVSRASFCMFVCEISQAGLVSRELI